MTVVVRDNAAASRYEILVDDQLAGFTEYRPRPGRIALTHTKILDGFSGQGLARRLVADQLADARRRGLGVLPFCPYVRKVIAENPDKYLDLVPATERERFRLPSVSKDQEQPMAADSVTAILDGLDSVRTWQEELYRELHAHPELSHQERRTARTVAARLRQDECVVHEQVGGTGVVGVIHNGEGPTVLLRADMDALPVREETGLPYASEQTGTDGDASVPVMHACGHDVHVTCLLGAVALLARAREHWSGTLVAVFQPAEETADGAQAMLDDGLAPIVGHVDVAMAQHVLPLPAGHVGTRVGPTLSAADSVRITVYGRGAHGSMPQAAVDPVVLAAMIVVRLQTVVSREVAPGDTAVLTVGSIAAGTKSNVIPDHAVLQLNVRTYDEQTRSSILDAIGRIVRAECEASRSPREPELELFDRYPLTDNDREVTDRVSSAFAAFFGDRASRLPPQSASEDFSDIPRAFGAPYTYWGIGGIDAGRFRAAEEAGRVTEDVPVNHSSTFAPVIQPTLDTGTQALVVAALAWL